MTVMAAMLLYPDSSAWVKRCCAETGSEETLDWFSRADTFSCCRVGFVETYRAITLAGLPRVDIARAEFERDWRHVAIIEVDEALMRHAAVLGATMRIRSLDSLHLAAADTLGGSDFALATWDRRLWQAARTLGIPVLPHEMPWKSRQC